MAVPPTDCSTGTILNGIAARLGDDAAASHDRLSHYAEQLSPASGRPPYRRSVNPHTSAAT